MPQQLEHVQDEESKVKADTIAEFSLLIVKAGIPYLFLVLIVTGALSLAIYGSNLVIEKTVPNRSVLAWENPAIMSFSPLNLVDARTGIPITIGEVIRSSLSYQNLRAFATKGQLTFVPADILNTSTIVERSSLHVFYHDQLTRDTINSAYLSPETNNAIVLLRNNPDLIINVTDGTIANNPHPAPHEILVLSPESEVLHHIELSPDLVPGGVDFHTVSPNGEWVLLIKSELGTGGDMVFDQFLLNTTTHQTQELEILGAVTNQGTVINVELAATSIEVTETNPQTNQAASVFTHTIPEGQFWSYAFSPNMKYVALHQGYPYNVNHTIEIIVVELASGTVQHFQASDSLTGVNDLGQPIIITRPNNRS